MARRPLPSPITITDTAAKRLKEIFDRGRQEGREVLGLRVGVKSTGCSGHAYFMEYAEEQKRFEDMVEANGVKLLIEPTSTMFLIGTTMDWVEEDLGARFVFNNPNEVDRCGCGESFRVAPEVEQQALTAKAQARA